MSFLKKNVFAVIVLLAVGFITINIISPLHDSLDIISGYSLQFIMLFIALGFMALRMQKPQIMLTCFVGSIVACNYLQEKEEQGIVKVDVVPSTIIKDLEEKILPNTKIIPTAAVSTIRPSSNLTQ